MNAAVAGRCARAVLSAARAGEMDEPGVAAAVDALARAAALFGTEDGELAAKVLQSSRVPAGERKGLLEELAGELELPREVAVLVEVLAAGRALRLLRAVAARASSLADAFTDVARVAVRTAGPLLEHNEEHNDEGVHGRPLLERIGAAMEKILGRPVRVEVSEDPGLLAGVVVKSGDRVWDGSLRGRTKRARKALSTAEAFAAAGSRE